MKHLALGLAAAVAAATLGQPALAEYPDKPIKVTVGFRAGGATDTLAKLVLEQMSKKLGVAIVTTNVTGAGGAVGTAKAAQARADGYNLVVGSNGTMTVSPQARNVGYTHEDFVPIGRWASVPNGWAVRSDSPVKSMEELVSHLKKNPGTKYTSVGTGSSVHLAASLWAEAAGLELVHIGNRGGRGAIVKLLSKEVDFIVVAATNLPSQIKGGKGDLRPIAVSTDGPWSYAPSIPTLKDAGYDLVLDSWWGLFAPKGIPEEAEKVLVEATREIMKTEKMRETLKKGYYTPAYASPDELEKIVEKDLATNRKALAGLGMLKK